MRTQEQRHIAAAATWEQKTGARISHAATERRFAVLREQREASLDARRRALAEKLHAEQQQYQRVRATRVQRVSLGSRCTYRYTYQVHVLCVGCAEFLSTHDTVLQELISLEHTTA